MSNVLIILLTMNNYCNVDTLLLPTPISKEVPIRNNETAPLRGADVTVRFLAVKLVNSTSEKIVSVIYVMGDSKVGVMWPR